MTLLKLLGNRRYDFTSRVNIENLLKIYKHDFVRTNINS